MSPNSNEDKGQNSPQREDNTRKRPRFKFHGYLSVFFSLTIAFAGALWLIYGYLPYQYYLPLSFLAVLVIGIIGYVILTKGVKI